MNRNTLKAFVYVVGIMAAFFIMAMLIAGLTDLIVNLNVLFIVCGCAFSLICAVMLGRAVVINRTEHDGTNTSVSIEASD